ncbi:unnamed protein product, partial [Heterobilharzia americana]
MAENSHSGNITPMNIEKSGDLDGKDVYLEKCIAFAEVTKTDRAVAMMYLQEYDWDLESYQVNHNLAALSIISTTPVLELDFCIVNLFILFDTALILHLFLKYILNQEVVKMIHLKLSMDKYFLQHREYP